MAAAVIGVSQPGHVAQILELVQQQHDVVGVHAEGVREGLLRALVVIADVGERHEVAQVHAQQLLVATAVELLGQARHQHHRAWRTRPLPSHVVKCIGHCNVCHKHTIDHKFSNDDP